MGEESFGLGRIGGIRVGVNWSVLVVFWLISWSLAAVVLPEQAPGWPSSVYWAAGLATAALFFASLLAHELGHAFVARRAGLRVEGITLWLFGGVARLRGEAENPGAELRIAGVGPLVSLAVAAVSGLLALGADAVGASPLLVGALAWLAWINGMLALFNLIPAAPLDGGRVLRAVAWRRTGDRLRATTIAARAGRVFGYVLIGLGLVRFAFQGNFGGLWLVFLGWFLLSAARAEESSARLREGLAGIRVRDVMTPDPVAGPGWYTVDAFLEEFVLRHRCSAFPVKSFDGDLVGLVTLARLKRVPADQRTGTRVSDVACPLAEVPVAAPEELLLDLLPRLTGCGDGRALVMADDRLVGIISPTDIARTLDLAALRNPRLGGAPSGGVAGGANAGDPWGGRR